MYRSGANDGSQKFRATRLVAAVVVTLGLAAMTTVVVGAAPGTASASTGAIWTQVGQVLEGNSLNSGFGVRISMSEDGSRMAVSAFADDTAGLDTGQVKVFDWSGSDWVQAGSALQGTRKSQQFGIYVALSADGNTLIVGTRGDTSVGVHAGEVTAYDWSGSDWILRPETIKTGIYDFLTLQSVSGDGSRVVFLEGGNSSGLTHAYDWTGSGWAQAGSDLPNGRNLLSADGNRLAHYDYTQQIGIVYEWSGSDWSPLGDPFLRNPESEHDAIPMAISADGSRILNGTGVFEWSGATWIAKDRLTDYRQEPFFEDATFTGNGQQLAVSFLEQETGARLVRIYDWSGSELTQVGGDVFQDPISNTVYVDFAADGSRLAVGSRGTGRGNLQVLEAEPTCNGLVPTINMNLPGTTGAGTPGDDVILGTAGVDVIDAGAGDDVVCAGAGDDEVVGGDGNDIMFGEGGRDIVRGNSGNDSIYGGNGNDRLLGGIGEDLLAGDLGNDFLGGFGGNDTIEGSDGDDTIFGGFGADLIDGGPGKDTVHGLIGNDTINGGPGDDRLDGDRGNDIINGGPGKDIIRGGNADDVLNGDDGDDVISGGKADDTLSGGLDTDICVGNKENIADIADATCESIFGVP